MVHLSALVALRKESVDRNRTPHHRNTRPIPSLSARRAWIEIGLSFARKIRYVVALRKESVDRNLLGRFLPFVWFVALRKESVDRNSLIILYAFIGVLSLSARRAWIEIGRPTT